MTIKELNSFLDIVYEKGGINDYHIIKKSVSINMYPVKLTANLEDSSRLIFNIEHPPIIVVDELGEKYGKSTHNSTMEFERETTRDVVRNNILTLINHHIQYYKDRILEREERIKAKREREKSTNPEDEEARLMEQEMKRAEKELQESMKNQ